MTATRETVLDPRRRRLAKTYATALVDLLDTPQAADVLDELRNLTDLIGGIEGAGELLRGLSLSRDKRVALVDRIFAGRISETLHRLLQVLAANDRLDLLRDLPTALEEVLDERAGRIVVDVTTPFPLNDPQRDELRQTLRQALHRECTLKEHVREDLLGGVVLRIGEKVYDASLAGQIDRMIGDRS